MVNCSNCRGEYAEWANFCPWCGHALSESKLVAVGTASAGEPIQEEPQSTPESLPWAQPADPISEVRNGDSSHLSSPRPPGPGRTSCAPFQNSSVLPPPVINTERAAPNPAMLAVDSKPASQPAHPRLVVIRGQNLNQAYPIYEGRNTIGRFADRPVDIDLMGQEAEGQVWSSRLHAAIIFGRGELRVEDLNSLNGTWLNGVRINPGQQRELKPGDILQIGVVQLRLVIE